MRLLVCGSREWTDEVSVRREIARLSPDYVIHGAAKGADSVAAYVATMWAVAEGRGLTVVPCPADWARYPRAAGIIRNRTMLENERPDRGLAFGALWRKDQSRLIVKAPGGWRLTGTGDMVSRMLTAGLPVRWVSSPSHSGIDLAEMPVAT